MTAPNPNYGIANVGDVLVNQTADGVDLTVLWNELRDVFALVSTERTALVSLLSYWHTATGDAVPQNVAGPDFEKASELGVPKAGLPTVDTLLLGFTLNDLDLATRFSWKFLRSASADQVRSVINAIAEADNRLVTGTILHRLFSPAVEHNEWKHPCLGIWNGDGTTPPPAMGKTFDNTHTHMMTTGADVIDSADLEDSFKHITEHLYGTKEVGGQLLIFANQQESELIQGFVAGQESRSSGPKAKHSFIPSVAAPPYLSPDFIVGQPAPATFNGLNVLGSYGPVFLIETNFTPAGYVAVVATNGPGSQNNVIGVREHQNPAYHGLRQIAGTYQNYPIIESYSLRTFGVGTRHRSAAVVLQVSDDPTYTAPPKSAFGIK